MFFYKKLGKNSICKEHLRPAVHPMLTIFVFKMMRVSTSSITLVIGVMSFCHMGIRVTRSDLGMVVLQKIYKKIIK